MDTRTRTYTAGIPGALALVVRFDHGHLRVVASPDCTRADVTVGNGDADVEDTPGGMDVHARGLTKATDRGGNVTNNFQGTAGNLVQLGNVSGSFSLDGDGITVSGGTLLSAPGELDIKARVPAGSTVTVVTARGEVSSIGDAEVITRRS